MGVTPARWVHDYFRTGQMTEPFTYLAATQCLDRAPLEYRAGDRFAIDHLVLVYSTARAPAQLEERYQSWAGKLQSNGK